MVIKILGSGCKSCSTLENNVKSAIAEIGLTADVQKITQFSDIAKYGVMQTPALVINEKVVSYGKVLKPSDIKKILEKV